LKRNCWFNEKHQRVSRRGKIIKQYRRSLQSLRQSVLKTTRHEEAIEVCMIRFNFVGSFNKFSNSTLYKQSHINNLRFLELAVGKTQSLLKIVLLYNFASELGAACPPHCAPPWGAMRRESPHCVIYWYRRERYLAKQN